MVVMVSPKEGMEIHEKELVDQLPGTGASTRPPVIIKMICQANVDRRPSRRNQRGSREKDSEKKRGFHGWENWVFVLSHDLAESAHGTRILNWA